MSFFISDAMAQAAPAAGGGQPGMINFVFLIVLFLIFYFLLLRPQMKRAKEHKKMTEAMAKNDEVVTSGGIAGKVVKVEDSFITVQIAQGVEVQVQKNAVSSLLPKGTIKF
jgi:preprotein translocase subunit YajC